MANKKNELTKFYVNCLDGSERLRNTINGKKRSLPEAWAIVVAASLLLDQFDKKIGEGIAQIFEDDSVSSNTGTDSENSQQTDSSSDTTTTSDPDTTSAENGE